MKMIVKNGKTEKSVNILSKEDNIFTATINDKEYILDIVKVEQGVYSILYNGQSINMEMIEGDEPGKYKVNTFCDYLELEVAPAVNTSIQGRAKKSGNELIKAPMSGKIVKVKVEVGDKIEEGDSLVILSAMKMENEIKSSMSGVISKISIKEEELVKDGQLIVTIKEGE